MSPRDGLDMLLGEVTPAVREALQRAYELGYREALSQAPAAASRDATSDGVGRLASDAPPSTPPPTAPAKPALFAWDQDSVPDDDDDDDRSRPDARKPRKRVGIRGSSTIATLKRRIEKEFALDRFDIDVLIIRTGDNNRRQLRADAPLSKYQRAE